jgi:hypothetical protein
VLCEEIVTSSRKKKYKEKNVGKNVKQKTTMLHARRESVKRVL